MDAADPVPVDDPVAGQWEYVSSLDDRLIDTNLVAIAHADPILRTLYPLVSHGSLQFSRCTNFPWSRDLPSIFPNGGGRFRVLLLHLPVDHADFRTEAETAEQAVAAVIAHLPKGCGPAVEGPPEALAALA